MNPLRLAARSMLASQFIILGADTLRNPAPRAEVAKPVIEQLRGVIPALPDNDNAVVRLDGAINVVFGTSLLLGKFQRISALILAGSLLPTTFGGHRFWEQEDPASKKNQQIHFQKNIAALGGLLFAALDRKGKPSLSYRASKAAKRANKALPDVHKS